MSLSPEFATEVRDLIFNILETPTTYSSGRSLNVVAHHIRNVYTLNQVRRLQTIAATDTHEPTLGEAVTDADMSLLREFFFQRPLLTLRTVLASLEEIGQLAEDVAPSTVAQLFSTFPAQDEVKSLRTEIDQL